MTATPHNGRRLVLSIADILALYGGVLDLPAARPRCVLVEVARGALGVTVLPAWGTMGQHGWDADVWVSDPRAARKLLDWRAATSLGDGLARTAAWLRARRRLWERSGAEEGVA